MTKRLGLPGYAKASPGEQTLAGEGNGPSLRAARRRGVAIQGGTHGIAALSALYVRMCEPSGEHTAVKANKKALDRHVASLLAMTTNEGFGSMLLGF